MRELAYSRATVIYLLLLLITAVSFWLTVGHGASALHEVRTLIWPQIIVLAFIKVRWVLLDFMELRSAPVKLRLLFEFWVVATAAALILINAVVG